MADLQMFVDRFGGAWEVSPGDPVFEACWLQFIDGTSLGLGCKRGSNIYVMVGMDNVYPPAVPLATYRTDREALNGVQVWVDYLTGGGTIEAWQIRQAAQAMSHQRGQPQLVALVSGHHARLVARERDLRAWIAQVVKWNNNPDNSSPGPKLEALDSTRREMDAWAAEAEKLARIYPPLQQYAARCRVKADDWAKVCHISSAKIRGETV